MKLTRDEVEAADFWDAGLCLECPKVCADKSEPCPDCGGEVVSAKLVLQVLDAIESNEGE